MLELVPNARMFAQVCMQVQPGQEILILADNTPREAMYGELMRDVINSLGAEGVLQIITPRKQRVHEPPKSAASAMLAADAIVRCAIMGMGHTNARIAVTKKGTKYFNIVNMPIEVWKEPYPVELVELVINRTEKVAKMLTEGKVAHVSTKAGTDLTVPIGGRMGMPLHSRSSVLADAPFVGGGESLVSPIEDGAYGQMVVDMHTHPNIGPMSIPTTWHVKNGKVYDITGGTDEERERELMLMHLDENANSIAEFAVDTGRPTSKAVESEEGSVHVGFGRSDDLGGVLYSKNHLDGYMRNATVEIDGVRILEDGRFLID